MSLGETILANEEIMDKLARIYVETLNAYYGNGKRGNDAMAKKDMIYYLEQNCGVCQTPSAISAQLAKIWGKIQETARKYGYRGPIMQAKQDEGLSYHLQDIVNKLVADERAMLLLGQACYHAATNKNLAKGVMMSDKYWGSYPNLIRDLVSERHWGYVSFGECKEIAKSIKKEITKYAKIHQQHKEAKDAAGEMNEGVDELSPKLIQKAADKAWDESRWSQAENFEGEAAKRAASEFGKDNYIRRITPKSIAYMSPDEDFCVIYRDGSYVFRPRSGYNNESGWLTGMSKFPDYMKVDDKRTARSLSRWWKFYYEGDKEVPFMSDWHNIVKW